MPLVTEGQCDFASTSSVCLKTASVSQGAQIPSGWVTLMYVQSNGVSNTNLVCTACWAAIQAAVVAAPVAVQLAPALVSPAQPMPAETGLSSSSSSS